MRIPRPFAKRQSVDETLTQAVVQFDPSEVLLALDVGTRYIKAVLYQVTQEQEVVLVGYGRVAQKYGAMRDAMIVNLKQVTEACDLAVGKAIEVAEKSGQHLTLPTRAVIGIAGELVRGVSIIANYQRPYPDQPISVAELDSVVDQVKTSSFNEAVAQISEEIGVETDQIQEISSRIDTTQIDGVRVYNPLGFTGKSVTYRVFSTFAPKIHLNALHNMAGELGLDESVIVVQPYAIARALAESKQENTGAIIIDIGGGTTDVALIANGGVLGTKMFAFGGDVLTRRIADQYKIEMPEAEELKLDYSDGSLSDGRQREIRALMLQDLKIWTEGVQIALEDLLADEEGELSSLPTQIYLCGGGAALPEIRELMLEHPWAQVLPFPKFPRVNYIYPNQLLQVSDDTRLLVEPSDVPPAAIARMAVDVG